MMVGACRQGQGGSTAALADRAESKDAPVRWPDVCQTGLVESVDRLAGPQAADCGFRIAPTEVWLRSTRECIRSANQAGRAFKAGYRHYGDTYQICEIALRTPDNQLLLLSHLFDMPDPSSPGDVVAELKAVRCLRLVDGKAAGDAPFFDRKDCVEAPEIVDALLAGPGGDRR